MTAEREPGTEAGRRLVSWYARDIWHPGMSYMTDDFAADILAIEDEARADLAARLRAWVKESRLSRSTAEYVLDAIRKEVKQ